MGPAGFGVFAFALSLQPYLYVRTLGTASVLFRDGVRQPDQLDQITTSYQLISLSAQLTLYTISSQGLRFSCEGDTDVCSWHASVH